MTANRKPIPTSILIFGANGRLGGPLAEYLTREAPSMRLRLATSKLTPVPTLQRKFPRAEVVAADYGDLPSLESAVQGMEGVFVLTPSGTAEEVPMRNLVAALTRAGTLIQLIRVLGMMPENNLRRLPPSLREHGLGLPIQHPLAKRILDDSDLPVTYLNVGATFLDNFFWMQAGISRDRRLVWPERTVPYIDPRDVAEAAARIFLSDNHRHIGVLHTLNNGHDLLGFREVAQVMSEVWRERITHDGTRERFFAEYAALGATRLQYLWNFFQFESEIDVGWSRNDCVERILGRKPMTLRRWLRKHRKPLLGPAPR